MSVSEIPQGEEGFTTAEIPQRGGRGGEEEGFIDEEWKVTVEEVENCSFGSWYESMKEITFLSKVFRLPQQHPLVKYLHADGVFVHHDRVDYDVIPEFYSHPKESSVPKKGKQSEGEEDDCTNQEIQAPHFPELEAEIKETIIQFGGTVFPKLNWSSPKDAVWISTTGTLKCDSPSEIFLLLKSSDFVTHDLSHAFDCCSEATKTSPDVVELVVRKWYELSPSLEFRCFVLEKQLVGISQRDYSSYYSFLADEKERIRGLIFDLFSTKIAPRFPSKDYVFDVYVSKNYDKVWVVDFSPSATTTEPLMFEWIELLDKPIPKNATPAELLKFIEFRIVESQTGVRPNTAQLNYVPKDLFDLSSAEGIDSFATAFRQGLLKTQTSSHSDDEDDSDEE